MAMGQVKPVTHSDQLLSRTDLVSVVGFSGLGQLWICGFRPGSGSGWI